MPAHDAHRLFLSTVTDELGRYRTALADRFEQVSVKVVYQEEFEYADTDLVEKLYQVIVPCDVVIHFVGQGAGAKANPKAVEDFLKRCEKRRQTGGRDFQTFAQQELGLSRAELDRLSYTQWEAVIALFLEKHFMPVQAMGPVNDGHPDGKPPFQPTDADRTAQERHLAWLTRTVRRYPQIVEEANGSYLEDAFHKVVGFLLRLPATSGFAAWQSSAEQLQRLFPVQKIAATRLVTRHTTDQLYGRDKELALLDAAWAARDTVNVQCVIAWGGVGKTALLAHWVQTRFRNGGWKDAQGRPDPVFYFDWTFYDQGTRSSHSEHAGAASVGTFFVEGLRHFGDPTPDQPERKAERLAALVQSHRSLLVLDGLEPLQYPHNHPKAGQITDPDLAQFLRLLAQKNPGLCLVSSREALSDLGGHLAANAPQHDLDDLPTASAIALLRKLQITGSDAELASAAADYQHHALSLILLGRFLFIARGGDIRRRDTVTIEKANDKRTAQTRSAWHVLETYERWLQGPAGNPIDLQALRLVGLFDRPARPDCLDALRQSPAIPGLTDRLVPLDRDDWNIVLQRLHEAHLIQLKFPPRDPASHAPSPEPRTVAVDAHPLIREYFARQLRDKEPTGFKDAHSRLFDHLCQSTEHQPDTLDGLQPLYQAVVHGCLAGRQQQAWDEVYAARILRGPEAFSAHKLGAIGANLGAVAAFFDTPWSRVSLNLSETGQASLLNQAGFHLRALGRLNEALEPMRAGLNSNVKAENWQQTAISASNLSQLEVTLGELASAVADARRAVDFADRIEPPDLFQRIGKRTSAADALHQSGEREEARRLFEQAEALQREDQPQFELLYSLRGFSYCDLILAPAECASWQEKKSEIRNPKSEIEAALAEAERRATRTLPIALHNKWLLDIALDHLTLARVALYRAMLLPRPPSSFSLQPSATALAALRKASSLNHLPNALLTAAASHHLAGDAVTARALLDEAQQIAERGPMPLFLADVHLHRARLAGRTKPEFRVKNWPGVDPKAELAKARALIEKHGYWRRREELADADTASAHWL